MRVQMVSETSVEAQTGDFILMRDSIELPYSVRFIMVKGNEYFTIDMSDGTIGTRNESLTQLVEWYQDNYLECKIIKNTEIDGETVETASDFILGGSKITADGDCSHEIKRCLLPGRKVMTNLDSILKSRDITLPTKVHLVKAMVFPVVMYGCESWTVKKAEH